MLKILHNRVGWLAGFSASFGWVHSCSCIPLEGWLGLGSAGTSGMAKHLSPRSHLFSRDWTRLYFFKWCQQFQEGKPQCINTYQAFTWVTCADVLVVKASHMAKPSLNMGGTITWTLGGVILWDSSEKQSLTVTSRGTMGNETGYRCQIATALLC